MNDCEHPSADTPHERGAGVCVGVAVTDTVASAEALLEDVGGVDDEAEALPPLAVPVAALLALGCTASLARAERDTNVAMEVPLGEDERLVERD